MEHQINEEIREKEVRLIDSEGQQLGIMPLQKALEAAEEKGLDLVNISPKANPPGKPEDKPFLGLSPRIFAALFSRPLA